MERWLHTQGTAGQCVWILDQKERYVNGTLGLVSFDKGSGFY